MTEPSVLTYARYFNLTRDHELDDPLNAIHTVISRPHSPIVLQCSDENLNNLVKKFQKAGEEYTSPANDVPLPLSKDAEHHLKVSTSYGNNDWSKICRDLLPDPYRFRKIKLELPLLITGGGDVQKDSQKIRRSVDTDYILDEFLQEVDDEKDESLKHNQNTASTLMPEFLEWSKDQVRAMTKQEKMEVTREALKYLREALAKKTDSESISETMQDLLPRSAEKGNCDAGPIGPDDFPLEADDKPLDIPRSEQDGIRLENSPPSMKQEHDLLSQLEAAVEEESFLGSVQVDREMEELLQDFTHHDTTDMDNLATCRMIDEFYDELPSAKKRKLEHHSDAEFLTTINEHTARSNASAEMTDLKVNSPDMLDHSSYILPDIDISRALALISGSESLGRVPPSTPFQIPTIHEAICTSMPPVSDTYEKYLTDVKKVTSSDKLLWKEPGIRLLDLDDTDKQVVLSDDFDTEEMEQDHLVIEQASNIQPPQLKGSSCGIAENQLKGTGFVNSDNKYALTSDKLSSASIGRSSRKILLGEGVNSNPESKMNSHDSKLVVALCPSNRELNLKINDSPCQPGLDNNVAIFRSLLPSSKRLRPAPNMVFKKEHKLDDSLANFLDLKGKQFIPPMPKQDLKQTADISDDPIQSTQDLPDEKLSSKEKSLSPMPTQTIETTRQEVIPPMNPLHEPRTVIVNTTLLQTRKPLIQSLESPDETNLTVIYRDLDIGHHRGPDIILTPTTCLLITSLQALNQRPLPGQSSITGLSSAHDQVTSLIESHSRVIILVHHIRSMNSVTQSKTTSTQASFSAFCLELSQSLPSISSGQIQPYWLPCTDPASTSKVVNAWVWQVIASYAHQHTSLLLSKSSIESSSDQALSPMIQDETLWEVFLRKAGLNPMAAQVVLGILRRPDTRGGDKGRTEQKEEPQESLGLRKLVAMDPRERVRLLAGPIGLDAVKHLNQIFSGRGHVM